MTRKQNPRVIPLEEPGGPYGYATYAARLVDALHDYFVAIPTERQIQHGLASSPVHADEPFGTWKGLAIPEDVRHFTARVHVGPRRGSEQDVRVQVNTEESPSPHYLVGGGLGLNKRGKVVLVLTLNGRYTARALAVATTPRLVTKRNRLFLHLPVDEDGISPMGAPIFTSILETIRHEVTHGVDPSVASRLAASLREEQLAAQLKARPDPAVARELAALRRKPTSVPSPAAHGRAAYLNDPAEVRAWGHDVVDQVRLFVNRYADVIRPNQLLERALDSSAAWGEVEPYLTPKNKQRVLSAVYRAVEEARPGALARLRDLRAAIAKDAEAGERRENPTPPSERTLRALGVERMEEALARAAERLQLPVPGPAYGCGEMGCAAPIGGRGGHRGRVLKVTADMHEIAAVEAAIEDGVFDGFARVFVPPVALWTAPDPILDEDRTVYAYVREDITPEMLPEGSPERVALIRLKRAADYKRLADFEAALPEVERLVPKVGAFARRLLDRGLMLGDMHAGNLGHRPGDPAFVLFDARVKPAPVDPLAGIREAFGRNENPARKAPRAPHACNMAKMSLGREPIDTSPEPSKSDAPVNEDRWGESHSGSSAITGESAYLLGIPGFRRGTEADTEIARQYLTRVGHGRTPRMLYSGHSTTPDLVEGQVVRLPLTALTEDESFARSFASGPSATVYRFERGIPGFKYSDLEWLTAGAFSVVRVRRARDPFWKTPLTVATLRVAKEGVGRNENPARKPSPLRAPPRAGDMAKMSRAELERLDFDDLSRAAFGVASDDEVLVPPSKLRIRWKADLANANEDMRRGILRHQVENETGITTGAIRGHAPTPRAWAEAVLLNAPPVDVDIVDAKGTYVLQDGHHRYVAAKLLRRPLRAVVQVKTNPIDAILAQRPREANPVGQQLPSAFLAALGASSAEDAAARAAHVLGVPAPVAVYGCGSMGCAASLPDGRVLKVTLDPSEVRAVEAIAEDGVFDGFARVDVPPRVVWTTKEPWIVSGDDDDVTEVYAYVREGLEPTVVEDRPTVSAFARLNEATAYTDERDFEEAVQLVHKHAPAIASLAVRLYDRGLMLGDVHQHNVGTRPGSSELVLFDAQVGYSGDVDVLVEERPARRRYERFRDHILGRRSI